jgi:low temperature requirement protein LtrA
LVTTAARTPRLTAVRRSEEGVTPLELFFDLVFVLAITQCTALMAVHGTWGELGKGLLVLALLWWSWVGYAWLTSVVNPEEGAVRFAMFAAMAALLVVSLCVPQAFGDSRMLFAVAYAGVRFGQIALLLLASRDEPELRHSTLGLAVGTSIGAGLLIFGALFDDDAIQAAIWTFALALDMLEPYLFGSEGWQLVPGHFAERHGLIIIIALGESIVAIGVGAHHHVDAGIVVAAALGIAVAGALWWLYFDIVALVAVRRLTRAKPGREQNEIARDSFSYLHFPMVAGIVLVALGMKKTLGDVDDHLKAVPALAMLGGTALYLLAHVAFRWRNVHRFNSARFACAILLVALIPLAIEIDALLTLALLAAILVVLLVYETIHFADLRERLRHQLASDQGSSP